MIVGIRLWTLQRAPFTGASDVALILSRDQRLVSWRDEASRLGSATGIELRKDRVEPAPLDAFHADAERHRHRRCNIAAANDRQLRAAANRRSGRNEQRVVVRVERALPVVAKIFRRAVLLYTVREIAERVARRRLEHRVAHQRVLRGGWQSERLEV